MVSIQMAALLVCMGRDGENGLRSVSAAECARTLGVDGVGATMFPRSAGGALVWDLDRVLGRRGGVRRAMTSGAICE